MGRFLLIAGLLIIVAGCGLSAFSFSSVVTGSIQSIVDSSVQGPQESELCQSGERLVEEAGASGYTPGQGYSRSVRYFCEDDAGNRREVTGQFAEDMVGSIFGAFGNLGNIAGGQFAGPAISALGVLMVIAGAISLRGKSARTVTVGGLGETTIHVGGRNVMIPTDIASHTQQASALSSSSAGEGADLTARLKQLDDARKAGLISQAEYDRLRQQILDSLKP